jgi:hypothetical protein
LGESEILVFESKHKIRLPPDYRGFLKEIGNGGSGPAYGLFPLSKWNFELEITGKDYLSGDFPYTEKWNRLQDFENEVEDYGNSEEFQKWEKAYYSDKHTTGSIRICHYGCAIYYLLVISGTEAGQIWVDDRASDKGIYPATSKSTKHKLAFIDWYDEWLTESIEQLVLAKNGK